MEYFWSDGGNNRPVFIYRFKVKKGIKEMFEWASAYPAKGPFSRFHVEWSMSRDKQYDVIQFEWSEAAKVFKIAFAGEYEDITMEDYRIK